MRIVRLLAVVFLVAGFGVARGDSTNDPSVTSTAVVFDKFVPKGRKVSLRRRFVNLFANLIASDLTRDLESIVENSGFKVVSDEEADWNGNFRLVKLMKL